MQRASSWFIHVCVNSVKLVSFALGALAIAAMAPACAREYSNPQEQSASQSDSISITISVPYKVKTLDFFIYRDSLNRPLESHFRLNDEKGKNERDNASGIEEGKSAELFEERGEKMNAEAGQKPGKAAGQEQSKANFKLPSSRGSKIIIAIANSPYEFNLKALQCFDSAELLTMYYRDENPQFPLMSAISFSDENSISLNLKALLCPVKVLSISNSTDKLLSHPRLSLRKINASAEMLRSDGFRPSITIDSPAEISHPQMMFSQLPFDLGYDTCHPMTTLYCYPQDAETSLGTPKTEIVLSAEVDGSTQQYATPLPKAGRGETIVINLNIRP